MSKKIKLLVTVTAVVILACAMAATAFAVSQTGKVNTNGYIGNYSANLQTTKERTDASLRPQRQQSRVSLKVGQVKLAIFSMRDLLSVKDIVPMDPARDIPMSQPRANIIFTTTCFAL